VDVGERGLETEGERNDRHELTKRSHGEGKSDVAPVREQPARPTAWKQLMERSGGEGKQEVRCGKAPVDPHQPADVRGI
jgi:hypothetical protein